MSLPFKPPPYERSNWAGLNEGKRQYAMRQYNLALARRGSTRPVLRPDQATPQPVPNPDDDYVDMFDLGLLGSPNQAAPPSSPELPTSQENEAPDQFLNQLQNRMADSSTGGSPMEGVAVSGKRGADAVSGATKKAKSNGTSGSKLPGTSGNTDGMSGAGGVPEGSVAIQNISRGLKTFSHTFTFQKRWKFLTFGVADQILSDTRTTAPVFDRWALTTSLATIPWEFAFFYISPAEWNRLREFKGVFAKHANIKVHQYNPRVAFQTADTTSTTATLNQNKFTRYGIGLRQNAALTCSDRDYIFDTDKQMKPTGFETTTHASRRLALCNAMYGVPNTSTAALMNSNIPAYATGQELGLSDYLTIYSPKTEDVGFVPYDQFCEEMNSMDLIGKEVLSQDYSFECAPLMPRWPAVMTPDMQDLSETTPRIPEGTKVTQLTSRTVSNGGNITLPTYQVNDQVRFLQGSNGDNLTNVDSSTFNAQDKMYYQYPMEQGGVYSEMNRTMADYAHQQSVHVGVRCVPKLSTNANLTQADDWLDTQIYWTVDAELTVEASDPFTFIRGGPRIMAANMQLAEAATVGTVTIPAIMNNDYAYVYGRRRLLRNIEVA